MKVVGVTGSSGSGKTSLSNILKEDYNAYIIDADSIAKKLSKNGTMYLKEIVNNFGTEIIDEVGELKRKKLAELIYTSNEKRNKLNEITFIYVVDEIKNNIREVNQNELIVIDAPLLFESELDKICDFVIGVIAEDELKVKRICKRDNISEKEALNRLSIQKNNDFIIKNSDYVIENNSDIENLKAKLAIIPLK